MMRADCEHVAKEGREELKILGKKIEIPKIPFPRISMAEAKKLLLKERGIKYGEDDELDSAGEKALGEIVKEKFGSDFVFTISPRAFSPALSSSSSSPYL